MIYQDYGAIGDGVHDDTAAIKWYSSYMTRFFILNWCYYV